MLRNTIVTVARPAAMFVRVYLLVGMLGASALSATDTSFHYSQLFGRTADSCTMCYVSDCFELSQARCRYYIKTDDILREKNEEKVDDLDIRTEVDNIMYTILEKANALATDCVPLISKYTDCSKENICTGCRSCECDGAGRWNCSLIEKCRADPYLDISYSVILTVIENLMNSGQSNRFKRSTRDKLEINENDISFREITEWLYGAKPRKHQKYKTTAKPHHKVIYAKEPIESWMKTENALLQSVTTEATTQNVITEHDYLAFDEVLNNIVFDSKIYRRKKPPPAEYYNTTTFDYMIFNDYNGTVDQFLFSSTDNTLNIGNDTNMENVQPELYNKGESEVIIDLLQKYKNISPTNTNNSDNIDFIDKNFYVDPVIVDNNYLSLNPVKIMKRDIAVTNNSNVEVNVNNDNTTNTVDELKQEVLLPLSNLINAKQKELEELIHISENLIKNMNSSKNLNIAIDIDRNKNRTETNSTFNIYKLEMVPEFDYSYDLRKINPNILEKLLYKLKRDVYEVIRDIVGIQKYTNQTKLPQDLKILIRAMKNYVQNQKNNAQEENMQNTESNVSFRRYDTQYKNSIIDDLVRILETVANNNSKSFALAPLSDTLQKIITRIVKQNYIKEYTKSRPGIIDQNYNLPDDLQAIGVKWLEAEKYLNNSSIFDKLYATKFLYLTLLVDIGKMGDALALIQFVHNRRMTPIDGQIGYSIIEKINKGLREIHDNVQIIFKLQNKGLRTGNSTKAYNFDKKLKKQTFFKKIRDALRNSRKDIVSLIRKKISKKNFVKDIANATLENITRRRFTEFEETMKKWQSNLDVIPRDRRSLREMKYKNRIKNILPNYLRGKLNPALAAKNTKKNNIKQKTLKTAGINIPHTTAKNRRKVKNLSKGKLN